MKRKHFRKIFSAMLCIALLAGILYIPPAQSVSADSGADTTKDFFSSFEASDPQPFKDTALTVDSKKMASGIIGSVPSIAIPGDITDKVVKITSRGENPPNEVTVNLIDGDVGSKWLDFNATSWIQFEFAQPEKVVKYALTSANDFSTRDPREWTLEGSNNGSTWTVLDTVKRTSDFPERYHTIIFDFANDTAYKYYKLNITKIGSGSTMQLAEVQFSDGIDVPVPPTPDMKSGLSNGPTGLYAAKNNVGWTGVKAFTYSGKITADGNVYSYNKIYDVNIDVTPNSELSYYIAPQFTDKNQIEYTSTYAAVDLLFTDGSFLHELGALDQHGVEVNAIAQGNSKTLYNNQWNFKKSNIGTVAAGKTIQSILVAYHNPAGITDQTFKGTLDDIKIEANPTPAQYSRLSEYANILRGTQSTGDFSRGNNAPAVAVPHGFNFWTPMTNADSGSWVYNYNRNNTSNNLPAIQAFAMNHEPSPWMGDRQTFQVMPSATVGTPSANRTERQLEFKHSNEIAKPYYYGVTFENGIKAEFVPTDHAAMFRFTFTGDSSNLIFDNQNNSGGITLNADGSIQGYSDQRSGNSVGATRMFFYATFDKPVKASGNPTANGGGANVSRYYKFDTTADKVVTMKVASSLISVEQAKKNLELEIAPTDTFDAIKERAQIQWDQLFEIVQVEGATEDQLVSLYSNMYRLYLWPNSAYENVGTNEAPVYKHANQSGTSSCSGSTAIATCAAIVDGIVYVNNGFWDTYRTTWPAYSLLTPEKAGELVEGFVQQYRDGGWISRWSSPGYANIMVGTSANVAFADAYLKGVTNFDVRDFYQSALKDATVSPTSQSYGRKGMATSVFDGYTNTGTGEGMSWAMDGYINDYGIANLAKALAELNDTTDPYNDHYIEDYEYFINRAQNYINMFNPNLEFFNGRTSTGAWRSTPSNFNPEAWGGDYTETNAWNMAFHAPQDGQGLANLYGGKEGLAAKLDEFFTKPETAMYTGSYGGIIHEMREARDVRMGQYGHSNQPSHHIPYMYNYAGQPWKTQEKVREVLDRLYIGSEIGQGYSGDEDNGEMSAWYIFSSMGFYPLKMGSPEYAIGAPLFKKATIQLENGSKIVINAPNNSKQNKYIQGLKLNGKEYSKTYIMHSDLANGAVLDFDMGPNPSAWGSGDNDAPISITQGTEVPKPYKDRTDKLIAAGAGKVSDSAGTAATALNNLFDNNSGTSATIGSKTAWIQYQFTKGAEKVNMYTLTSVSGTSRANDPKSWVLEGSNNGKDWMAVDTRTNESFAWAQQTKAYKIQNPAEYSYYRLNVSANNGGNSLALAEIELLAPDLSDQDAVTLATAALDLGDTSKVTAMVALPSAGVQGTTIAWSSSDTSVLSHTGKVMARPGMGEPDITLTLTATITKGIATAVKTFSVTVKARSKDDFQYDAAIDFYSGFEPDHIQPTWNNSRLESKNINEWCCSIGGMESKVGTVDFDKTNALLYSGSAADASENYSYNQIFDAAFDIKPNTVLSYNLFPEGPNAISQTDHIRKTSQYIAVDLLFTDGTYLHDLNAVDQNGVALNPLAQGQSGNLKLDAWNTVTANVGAVAAGKVVDKILLSFNATGFTGDFRGYVDNIKLEHEAGAFSTSAALSGTDSVISGEAFDLFYGLEFVTDSVAAHDITIHFDPSKVEFVSVESLKEHFTIVEKKVSADSVRILAASIGQGNEVSIDGNLLKLQFKAKANAESATAAFRLSDVVVAGSNGDELPLNDASHNVRIAVVDKAELNALIANAQSTLDKAEEGTKPGQYPAGSKALLQAAIDKASEIAGNGSATQPQVEQAVADLSAALQAFIASVNVRIPGDINGDGIISIGDLAIVAKYYSKKLGDPDWDQAKIADVNGDNVIDIEDLVIMAKKILKTE